MSVHQKRVTITAVDLSKVSENCCVVLTCDDLPSESEILGLRNMLLIDFQARGLDPSTLKIAVLKKGQTLTVEQLPQRTEQQIIDDFKALAKVHQERRDSAPQPT